MALNRVLRNLRSRMAGGYLLARISKGDGPAELVTVSDLVNASLLGSAAQDSSDKFVQSIALTAPSEITVAGSPVTGPGGTLALTWHTQAANKIFAGPTTGSAATPTFRSLVSADMPSSGAGSGTVTSVALTVPSRQSVSGSPITTAGTLAITDNNQNANIVFAGPSTGSAAAPGFRSLVTADFPASGVTAASYGDSTHATNFTVDATGRLTAASSVAIPQGTVTTTGSPASGNLTKFSGASSVTNGDLSGDVTTSGTLATTLANTAVSAGSYGDSTHATNFTVDAKGRLTAASSVAIPQGDVVGPASAVGNNVVFFNGTTGKLIKDSGLALSGSNTGDQTITLTGNVTGSGTGSFATTIAAGVVTEAMQVLADNTTQNVSSTKHGYAPKSGADATTFLNGAATPAYAQVKDSDLALTDITTNNVSISKHGFAPKAPNDSTKFLDGTGAYSALIGIDSADHAHSPFQAGASIIRVVLVDASAGNVQIDPPSSLSNGLIVLIKDGAQSAETHTISFSGTVGTGDKAAVGVNGGWLIYVYELSTTKWRQIG